MAEIELVVSVVALFMIRIGIPLILLITLGTVIDHWQNKQHDEARQRREQNQA